MARRIKFDSTTINAIRQFMEIEHNPISVTANRFGVSEDTLRRVMYENNIAPGHPEKRSVKPAKVSDTTISQIIHLFTDTNMPLADICKQVKLEYYIFQDVLKTYFTESEINDRKHKLYSISKQGDANPMKCKIGARYPNWKGGVVSDGQGYLMVKKPDWYTGRPNSDYVFQHSVVMCEALGLTEIPKGFIVHHIDYNPHNNNINNLALIQMGGHCRLHNIEKTMMMPCKVQRLSNTGVGESPNA